VGSQCVIKTTGHAGKQEEQDRLSTARCPEAQVATRSVKTHTNQVPRFSMWWATSHGCLLLRGSGPCSNRTLQRVNKLNAHPGQQHHPEVTGKQKTF
jgi:hypothetical protein